VTLKIAATIQYIKLYLVFADITSSSRFSLGIKVPATSQVMLHTPVGKTNNPAQSRSQHPPADFAALRFQHLLPSA
jgi:hypothetical protein